MAELRDLWPYARSWWGATVALATFLAAAYYGPKKMLETWDWYRDRWCDSKVRDVLRDQRQKEAVSLSGGRRVYWAYPISVTEISRITGVSQKGVLARLGRLHGKGQAFMLPDGTWKANDLLE